MKLPPKSDANEFSTRTILFHTAIADKLGLNPTDHKCVIFLLDGKKTVGELATATGLTLGAQTASVDRLVRGGFVSRIHNQRDRREVFIELLPEGYDKIAMYFMPLGKAMSKLEARYTQDQLELILTYMREAATVLQQETERLKGMSKSS